jgi:hypothetical protein
LTIFKLAKGETPDQIYEGEYQDQVGYVRSQRKGAPVGMREDEWENSLVEGGPEAILDNLVKSGYPWHALGQRLKIIDQQFKSVTGEYAEIRDTLDKLTNEVDLIRKEYRDIANKISDTVRTTIADQVLVLQNRWLIGVGAIFAALVGLVLSITGNEKIFQFLQQNGAWIGVVMVLLGIITLIVISKRKGPPGSRT